MLPSGDCLLISGTTGVFSHVFLRPPAPTGTWSQITIMKRLGGPVGPVSDSQTFTDTDSDSVSLRRSLRRHDVCCVSEETSQVSSQVSRVKSSD